ncbi:MAG TPA: hypothetical protein VLB04_01335 [Methanotrichaceae archaeon]|nr:hypothetical protein [Methanotrichaceae archaeon]
MAEKKKQTKNIDPATTGSQLGMGGSAGLEGSYVQGAGSRSGMTSVSSGFENLPERGNVGGAGSKVRKSGEQMEPEK